MQLAIKDVVCKCGHANQINRKTDWCEKCGMKIFYDEKDQKRNKYAVFYTYVLLFGIIGFLAFVFVELLLVPAFRM